MRPPAAEAAGDTGAEGQDAARDEEHGRTARRMEEERSRVQAAGGGWVELYRARLCFEFAPGAAATRTVNPPAYSNSLPNQVSETNAAVRKQTMTDTNKTFCDQCGHANRAEAKFCKGCGATMEEQR